MFMVPFPVSFISSFIQVQIHCHHYFTLYSSVAVVGSIMMLGGIFPAMRAAAAAYWSGSRLAAAYTPELKSMTLR